MRCNTVGFAAQDGVPHEKCGEIGCGGIISIAPVLSSAVTDKIISISKKLKMNCDYEVCGGTTGTNADGISAAKGGIPCGVISIPEKNMHTQTEIVSLDDMEKIAELLSVYVMEGGDYNSKTNKILGSVSLRYSPLFFCIISKMKDNRKRKK